MKTASILALASSASAVNFGIMVSRSASPIHLTEVNANGRALWIGKDTASYCPLDSGCPPGNDTLFAGGADTKTLSMAVNVPGGQLVYVDPKDGAIGYTQAHSVSTPEGAIYKAFVYEAPEDGAAFGHLTFKRDGRDRGFLACSVKGDSEKGPWKIHANLPRVDFDDDACLGFSALAVTGPKKGKQVGAWQYT